MSLIAVALETANKFSQNAEQVGNGMDACGLAFIGLLEGWAMEQGQNYDYAKSWSRWLFAGALALEELAALSNDQYVVALLLGITFAVGAGVHHMPRETAN